MILETRQGRRNPVRNITLLKLKLKSPSYDNGKEHEIETRSATKFIRTHTSRPHATDPVKISKCAWKVVIVLSCIATMVMFAETMLIPAIPDLIADFHVSYSMSSWILTAYLVSDVVMTPIAGKLSGIWKEENPANHNDCVCQSGFAIGFCIKCNILLIARAIQGVGMSMFPIVFSIIKDQFQREKMSIGQDIVTSMFASGAVIGLTVGGIIIQNYGRMMTLFTIIPGRNRIISSYSIFYPY